MAFPTVYLSRPSVVLPEKHLDNEELLGMVRNQFKGSERVWSRIEATIRFTFRRCGSKSRYMETDPTVRVADYAAQAAQECLEANGVDARELDLLIYGGIAREYFEPATAMEVAAKLKTGPIHAFDVTSACVGQLEAIHIACAHLNIHPHMRTALVTSAELTRHFLQYDIQSTEEVKVKAAGLTIGNAAAAFLIRRDPFPEGGIRLRYINNLSLPEHWHLCTVPIDGSFTSRSFELFKLHTHVAPEFKRTLDRVGWAVDDVDHFVCHQPSDTIVRKVLTDLGASPDRGILTHSLFGNTSTTTVPLALHQLLEQNLVEPGHKLLLSSAASGFTIVTAAGEWSN